MCELSKDNREAFCPGLELSKIPSNLPAWIRRLTLDQNRISQININYLLTIYPNINFISLKENPICVADTESNDKVIFEKILTTS